MVKDVQAAEPAEKAVADMTVQEAREALARHEAEKLTRRAALAKIGMRAGLGVLAAFSVEDLARMVARRMEQQAGQNAALDKVAREMHDAGIAFATTATPSTQPLCRYEDENGDPYFAPCPDNKCKGNCCKACNKWAAAVKQCGIERANCTNTPTICDGQQTACNKSATDTFDTEFAGCGCECQNCKE